MHDKQDISRGQYVFMFQVRVYSYLYFLSTVILKDNFLLCVCDIFMNSFHPSFPFFVVFDVKDENSFLVVVGLSVTSANRCCVTRGDCNFFPLAF